MDILEIRQLISSNKKLDCRLWFDKDANGVEVVSSSSVESNHRIIIYRDGERSARTGSKRSISSPICSE